MSRAEKKKKTSKFYLSFFNNLIGEFRCCSSEGDFSGFLEIDGGAQQSLIEQDTINFDISCSLLLLM